METATGPVRMGIRMERRELLAALTAMFGGALAAPCVSFLERADAATGATASLFTPPQRELVATATELILPTTDTPGAREAGVPAFLERMLVDWFYDDEREDFMAGLASLDLRAKEKTGESFVDSPEGDQVAILEALEKEGLQQMQKRGVSPMSLVQANAPAPAFFPSLKQMTLLGYYTSEVGATQELVFNPIPGKYEPCANVGAHGRVWLGL